MVFPKDGKFFCNKCGKEVDSNGKVESFTTDAKANQTVVQSSSDTTLPKTRVVCPKCGYTEAGFTIRQTRAADEPETIIYRCCNPKCNHTWRQY